MMPPCFCKDNDFEVLFGIYAAVLEIDGVKHLAIRLVYEIPGFLDVDVRHPHCFVHMVQAGVYRVLVHAGFIVGYGRP